MRVTNSKFSSLVILAWWFTSSITWTTMILTPVDAGGVESSVWNFNHDRAFGDQPVWDADLGEPVGGDSGNSSIFHLTHAPGEVLFIDLGDNWSDWSIEQTWTQYSNFRSGEGLPFERLWWGESKNVAFEDGTEETTLNFWTQYHDGTAGQWLRDIDTTANPVIPQGQFLLVQWPEEIPEEAAVAGSNGAAVELAFTGFYHIPEPATLSLLAFSVGLILYMQRQRDRMNRRSCRPD